MSEQVEVIDLKFHCSSCDFVFWADYRTEVKCPRCHSFDVVLEYYECGYPVGAPPFPSCCTILGGGRCQLEGER